jgi:hypothetical protein
MRLTFFPFLIIMIVTTAGCSQASASSSKLLKITRQVPTWSLIDESTSTFTPLYTKSEFTKSAATATQSPTIDLSDKKPSPTFKVTTEVPTSEKMAAIITPSATPVFTATASPDDWMELPVIPVVADEVIDIYRLGQSLGNNPRAFSKIGDCGSTPAWFLGDFDRGPRFYKLGNYQYLQGVIDYYHGSFDRTSLAARSGFNTSALFVPLWADREFCASDESPLGCEYRNQKPSIAFIMLGANDVWHPQEFEPQMRRIIEYFIGNGVIPILTTKPDNQEGDWSINATIARLAYEYKVPLWNFWRAANPLPDNGLQEDQVHLTWGPNLFDDPEVMKQAWPVRNLTALQTLNAVWEKIGAQ